MMFLTLIKGYKRYAVFPIFLLVRILKFTSSIFRINQRKVLAIYCGGNRGNIIDLLLRDLFRSVDPVSHLNVKFYYDLPSFLLDYVLFDLNIFCCHYALIRDLSFYGVTLSRISSFYTHSYIDRLHSASLLQCNKLL